MSAKGITIVRFRVQESGTKKNMEFGVVWLAQVAISNFYFLQKTKFRSMHLTLYRYTDLNNPDLITIPDTLTVQ